MPARGTRTNPESVAISSAYSAVAHTNVSASVTVVTLLPANLARKGFNLYNDSASLAYVRLGPAASLTNYDFPLQGNGSGTGGYYEELNGYTGIITCIWVSATGNARVGERT